MTVEAGKLVSPKDPSRPISASDSPGGGWKRSLRGGPWMVLDSVPRLVDPSGEWFLQLQVFTLPDGQGEERLWVSETVVKVVS